MGKTFKDLDIGTIFTIDGDPKLSADWIVKIEPRDGWNAVWVWLGVVGRVHDEQQVHVVNVLCWEHE